MKAIRNYFFNKENTVLTQRSVFFPEDDSLDDPQECLCQAYVVPLLPGDNFEGPVISLLVKDADFSLDLRIQEMEHFLTVLKILYYGS